MKKNSTARKTSKQPAAPLKDSASRKPASDAQPLKAGMLQYLKGASSENTESAPPPAKPKDREGATAKMKRRILGLAGGTGNAGQTSTTSTRKALGSMDEKSVNKVLPRSVIVERAVQQPAGPPVVVVVPSQDVQQAGRRTSVDGSKRSNKRPSLPLEDPAVDEGSPKKGRTARSPKKPLKPSDSGFSEETLQPRQSQEASSTSAVSPDLPLTQATPVKKTDQEDRIYWRDSPPSGKLNAAASAIEGRKRDTRAEAKYVASLLAGEKVATPKENSPTLGNKPRHPARSNPELTPSHGKTSYKRSFSLSNLEGSPSALFRNTDPKQIRRERLTHWSTGGKRPNSFSVPGLELFNQPNCSAGPTTLDGRQSGEESCRCSAATTPDSVKRRRLNRSATFPNPSSAWPGSPKGKSSTFDDDNFKENIPPWERQRAQKRLEQAGLLDSNPRHRKDDRLTMKDTRKLQQKQRDTVKVEIEVSDKFSDPDDSDDFACSMALDAFMAEGEVAVVKGESETSTRTHSRANTNVPLVDEPVKSEPQRYTRFLVLEVSWNEYGFPDGPARNKEKKLRLFNEQEQNERFLHLREDWWTTDVNVGDYIHVIGTFDPNLNRCIVDNEKNLVILHPDNLVSATLVAESFDCLRKSILQDRVRSLGESTPPLVYGSLLHCLLQAGLKDGDFSDVRMDDEIDKLVKSSVEDLYAAGEDEEKARQHLKEFVPSLQQWSQMFMRGSPEPDAIVKQHRGDGREKSSLSISKVLDIEDQIWSPMFGIKGNIDASIQINVTEGIFGATRTLAAPFELKTGKSTNVVSHRAQTTLYTLMMGDRYGVDIAGGILYYLKANEMIQIPSFRNEVRGLIIARNEMAGFKNNTTGKLPPMIQNQFACQRCYALDKCMVYHKAVENGTAESSGLSTLFEQRTGHLTPAHLQFFEHWDRLLTLEEGDMQRSRKEIWTMRGSERENLRRCFSGLRLQPLEPGSQAAAVGAQQREYRFVRGAAENPDGTPLPSFLNSHITVGDAIVVSTEQGHYGLATGFVSDLQPAAITILLNRELNGPPKRVRNDFDECDNQNFEGVLNLLSKRKTATRRNEFAGTASGTPWPGSLGSGPDKTLYRIDKDEMASGMGLVRANMVSLLSADGDPRRRDLIVDLKAPGYTHDVQGGPVDEKLNTDQRRAVERVLAANDYSLILGMPGTGKTTTISYIIQTLVKRGKSVLLTSYTHTAVDNVLLKLHEEGFDFLRLGSGQKIHQRIQPYTLAEHKEIDTVKKLEEFYASKNVVATTCLGINHVLFSKRRFDYCIVDEAAQLTLPVCLGPLRFANVFVLVGDHYQLPPLVRNAEAREAGMSASLFKRLSEAHPESVVALEHQYRLNEDIMILSNILVYNNRLRCGTAAVANSRLDIPRLEEGMSLVHSRKVARPCYQGERICWIRDVLEPRRTVVFINTDDVPAPDSRLGDLVQNDIEASMVHQLVESLIASGVNESALGVISPYRSQLKIIHHLLKHRTNLAIHTVDKFQGSDKECVVISLVRSNPKQNLGDLIRDWRRINVSFTRAKKKLVIFGSRSTLEGTALFAEFLNIIDEKAWELKLPIGAHDMHIIPPADDTPSAIVKQTDSVNIETGRHSIDKKQATVTRLKTKTATMHTKKTRQSVLGNNIAGAIA